MVDMVGVYVIDDIAELIEGEEFDMAVKKRHCGFSVVPYLGWGLDI